MCKQESSEDHMHVHDKHTTPRVCIATSPPVVHSYEYCDEELASDIATMTDICTYSLSQTVCEAVTEMYHDKQGNPIVHKNDILEYAKNQSNLLQMCRLLSVRTHISIATMLTIWGIGLQNFHCTALEVIKKMLRRLKPHEIDVRVVGILRLCMPTYSYVYRTNYHEYSRDTYPVLHKELEKLLKNLRKQFSTPQALESFHLHMYYTFGTTLFASYNPKKIIILEDDMLPAVESSILPLMKRQRLRLNV